MKGEQAHRHLYLSPWWCYNPLQWDTASSRALPAARKQALTCSNIPNCSLLSWQCISHVSQEGYLKIQSQLFSSQIFSTSFVPDRNLLRTLLSSNNFFLLFWVGTADFRLQSKVTRQNAIPNNYRSPLPLPAGLSLLPDTTALKLLSIVLCSEYPFKVSPEGTEQNTSCFSLCWSVRGFSFNYCPWS